MRAVVALLVASLVLAGCSGGRSAEPSPTEPAEGTGVLSGLVLDDEFRPLAGAAVGFVDAQARAFVNATDSSGFYRIERVPAGRLQVTAQLVNFLPSQREVIMLPGQEKRLDFQLAPLRGINAPRNETTPFSGSYECAAETPLSTGSCDALVGGGAFSSEANHSFHLSGGWGGLLLELDWSVGSSSDAVAGARLRVESMSNETVYIQAEGPQDPLRTWVNASQVHAGASNGSILPPDGADVRLFVEPLGHEPGSGCTPGQPCPTFGAGLDFEYTLYVTVFFNGPAEPSHSAVPPGSP